MRCNPFGYATDAGPARLMGGMYGPEYAGKLTLDGTGTHGVAVCTAPYVARYVMVCPEGHSGPIMELCDYHAQMIVSRYSRTCTACVWPDEARGLDEQINRIQGELAITRDLVSAARLRDRAQDLGRQMDELRARGVIATRPLRLVEVS